MANGLGLSTRVLSEPTITSPMYERDGEWYPVPTPTPLRETIRAALLNALAYTSGDQQWAARLLGMTPRALGYQMQMCSIPRGTTGQSGKPRGGRRPTS